MGIYVFLSLEMNIQAHFTSVYWGKVALLSCMFNSTPCMSWGRALKPCRINVGCPTSCISKTIDKFISISEPEFFTCKAGVNIYVLWLESINGSLYIKGLVCGTCMVFTVATLSTVTAVAITFKVVQSSLQVLLVWAHQRASWSVIMCLITRAQLVPVLCIVCLHMSSDKCKS